MEITKEESEEYRFGEMIGGILANALRRHVAAEMRLEFLNGHWPSEDVRWNYVYDDWDRAAHEALINGS